MVRSIVVTKGSVTIGEIRKPKVAETFRYYPGKASFLNPPALEDPDLESLKKRIADHFTVR